MTTTPIARSELDLPLAVTSLMKGVVYADTHPKVWRHLLQLQARVGDYVATLGLTVVVDEAEGYAFLRQRGEDETEDGDRAGAVPRLVPRRSLSFPVSLLLALLRRRLAEFDASAGGLSDGGTSCVLSRRQIIDMVEVFLPVGSNEARLVDQVDAHIGKVVELGFLRRVKDGGSGSGAGAEREAEPAYEVRRIVKAFVDAQWLAGLDEGLRRYAIEVGALPPDRSTDQHDDLDDDPDEVDDEGEAAP